MRPRALAVALVCTAPLAIAGCGRIKADSSSADAAPISIPDASSSPSFAKVVGLMTLARVYRGTLDSKHAIVMRLARTGDALEGTYFYEPSVSDLHLKGTIAPDTNAIHLDESSGKTPTGAFDGTIDPSGAFSGTWSDPKHTRSLAFHVTAVTAAAGAPALLVTRSATSSRKPKQKVPADSWPFGEPSCKSDVRFFEAIAGFDPKSEASVNELLRADEPSASDCDGPVEHEFSSKVRVNDHGVLSVVGGSSHYESGMPHPAYGRVFINVEVPSGVPIKITDVLMPSAEEAILKRLGPDLAKLDDDTRALVKDALALSQVDFSLDATGLRLSTFNQLPHAFKGADGEDGFFIPASALAAVRVKPSPVDRLWR